MVDSRIKKIVYTDYRPNDAFGGVISFNITLLDGTEFSLPTADNKATINAESGVLVWSDTNNKELFSDEHRQPKELPDDLDESWYFYYRGERWFDFIRSPLLATIVYRLNWDGSKSIPLGSVLYDADAGINVMDDYRFDVTFVEMLERAGKDRLDRLEI